MVSQLFGVVFFQAPFHHLSSWSCLLLHVVTRYVVLQVASALRRIASQSHPTKPSTAAAAAAAVKTPEDDGTGFIHGSIPARPGTLQANAVRLSAAGAFEFHGASASDPVVESPGR